MVDNSLIGVPKQRLGLVGKVVTGIVLSSALLVAHAAPANVRIISDGTWKSTDVEAQGWETRSFDDSGWVAARAPYPHPQAQQIPGSTAHNIWYDPASTSDGTTGSIEAFFRKSFTLNLQADSLPLGGQALINVDDDYEFYVNGDLALGDYDGGASGVQFVDFTRFLKNGENVFAIHAVDGSWDQPVDRIYEYVSFDATIQTAAAVPEPGTWALLAVGLGLVGFRVANRRSVS